MRNGSPINLSRNRQGIAHGEREERVYGAAVVDELPVIGVEGAGPPAAR